MLANMGTAMRRTRIVAITVTVVTLSIAWGPAAKATFPGGNGDIAFGRKGDIWVFRGGDSSPTRLANTPGREGLPEWNATGSQVAFTRCLGGEFGNCDIWVMDADGSGQTRITKTAVAQETWPTWSPDGSMIAFTSNKADEFQDIWVMDADGSNKIRLTTTLGFDAFPEWSPDGTQIAFTSDRDAVDDIWVIGSDGSDPLRLTKGQKVDERPDWSPDGTLITFSRNSNIWVMDADGGDPTPLTAGPRVEFAPTFSPNGRRIAFNRQSNDDRFGVWIMRADGSHRVQKTFGKFDFFPDWQPI